MVMRPLLRRTPEAANALGFAFPYSMQMLVGDTIE